MAQSGYYQVAAEALRCTWLVQKTRRDGELKKINGGGTVEFVDEGQDQRGSIAQRRLGIGANRRGTN